MKKPASTAQIITIATLAIVVVCLCILVVYALDTSGTPAAPAAAPATSGPVQQYPVPPAPAERPVQPLQPYRSAPAPLAPKGNGHYLINVDIAPGVWRSDGAGTSCYWQVTTATGDIISNDFGMAGGTAYIPPTGFAVMFKDCGTWTYLQGP